MQTTEAYLVHEVFLSADFWSIQQQFGCQKCDGTMGGGHLDNT